MTTNNEKVAEMVRRLLQSQEDIEAIMASEVVNLSREFMDALIKFNLNSSLTMGLIARKVQEKVTNDPAGVLQIAAKALVWLSDLAEEAESLSAHHRHTPDEASWRSGDEASVADELDSMLEMLRIDMPDLSSVTVTDEMYARLTDFISDGPLTSYKTPVRGLVADLRGMVRAGKPRSEVIAMLGPANKPPSMQVWSMKALRYMVTGEETSK